MALSVTPSSIYSLPRKGVPLAPAVPTLAQPLQHPPDKDTFEYGLDHPVNNKELTAKQKSPWPAVLGIGAVVGALVLGVVALRGRGAEQAVEHQHPTPPKAHTNPSGHVHGADCSPDCEH